MESSEVLIIPSAAATDIVLSNSGNTILSPGRSVSSSVMCEKELQIVDADSLLGVSRAESPIDGAEIGGAAEDSESQGRQFALFQKLPIELRIQIWRRALPDPRIMDVCLDGDWDHETNEPYDLRILINHPPPVLLQVCQEARKEALMKYRTCLSTKSAVSLHRIDPDRDTIYVQLSPNMGYQDCFVSGEFLDEGLLTAIKYLAVDIDVWVDYKKLDMGHFPNLQEVILVLHNDECSDTWRMEKTDITFIDPDLEILDGTHRGEAVGAFESYLEAENDNRELKMPTLKIKCMERASKRCCP